MAPKEKKYSCGVCCNNVAAVMSCANCDDVACLSCTKKFIFSGLRKYACCMFCEKQFTKEALFSVFPASWMKDYKEYQRNFAIAREEALLPSTIDYAASLQKEIDLQALFSKTEKEYKRLLNVFASEATYENSPNISEYSQEEIKTLYTLALQYIDSGKFSGIDNSQLDTKLFYSFENQKNINELRMRCANYVQNESFNTPIEKEIFDYIMRDDCIQKNLLFLLVQIINRNKKEESDDSKTAKKRELSENNSISEYATFIRLISIYKIIISNEHDRIIYTRIMEIIKNVLLIINSGYYKKNSTYNIILFKNFEIKKIEDCIHCNGPVCNVSKKSKSSSKIMSKILCLACGFNSCTECNGFSHKNKCNNTPVTINNYKESFELYNVLRISIVELKKELEIIKEANAFGLEKKQIKNKAEILHHCKSCNGYVIKKTNIDGTNNYHCAICNKLHCRKCQELDHTGDCDETIVANVKEIASNTKPCPNCHVRVFKIEGCYQMFCVLCGTAFDWSTGKAIINETIHNPHYAEYLRRTRENNNPCTDTTITNCLNLISCLPKHNFDEHFTYNEFKIPGFAGKYAKKRDSINLLSREISHRNAIQSFYSLCGEIEVDLQKEINYDEKFTLLRANYLINRITKDKFHHQVGTLELQREKTQSENLIYRNFIAIMHDYFRTINLNNYKSYTDDMIKLFNITCDALCNLAAHLQLSIKIPQLKDMHLV